MRPAALRRFEPRSAIRRWLTTGRRSRRPRRSRGSSQRSGFPRTRIVRIDGSHRRGAAVRVDPGALFRAIGPVAQTWTIEDVIAEGDRVVVRATNTCTRDSFFDVPAHGRPQVFSAIFIFQIEAGKVVRTWRNADDLGRLLQLGARLVPGEPPAPPAH